MLSVLGDLARTCGSPRVEQARAAEDAERRAAADREQAQQRQQQQRHAHAISEAQAYRIREKTLLEQVLNYTTTGSEDGHVGDSDFEFWISGHNGEHKCILTRFRPDARFGLLEFGRLGQDRAHLQTRGIRDSDRLDLRQINLDGLRIQKILASNSRYLVVGDERTRVVNWFSGAALLGDRPRPVTERLQRAWSLAMRECPGRRSAF